MLSLSPITGLILFLILLYAAIYDLYNHKIKNGTVIVVFLLGIFSQLFMKGAAGLGDALLGSLVGFFLFLPHHMLKKLGAGDVKLMGALGAVFGYQLILWASIYTVIAGAIGGILVVAYKGEAFAFFSRWFFILKMSVLSAGVHYEAPKKGSVASSKFPYAFAIFVGSSVLLYQELLI